MKCAKVYNCEILGGPWDNASTALSLKSEAAKAATVYVLLPSDW